MKYLDYHIHESGKSELIKIMADEETLFVFINYEYKPSFDSIDMKYIEFNNFNEALILGDDYSGEILKNNGVEDIVFVSQSSFSENEEVCRHINETFDFQVMFMFGKE